MRKKKIASAGCWVGVVKSILAMCLGLNTAGFVSLASAVEVVVSDQDTYAKTCNAFGFKGTWEGRELILEFQTKGFPDQDDIEYEYLITRDGFVESQEDDLYEKVVTTESTLRLRTPYLLPSMDFGAVSLLLEARDSAGNYAMTTKVFEVSRRFRLSKVGRILCTRLGQGEVVSGLYENETEAVRAIDFQDSDVEHFSRQVEEYQGYWVGLRPSIGLASIGFGKNNAHIKQKFHEMLLYQSKTTRKTLAPFKRAYLVRRPRTIYEVYKVYAVGSCGDLYFDTDIVVQTVHPAYEWLYVQGSESGLDVSMDSLNQESTNCTEKHLEKLSGQFVSVKP